MNYCNHEIGYEGNTDIKCPDCKKMQGKGKEKGKASAATVTSVTVDELKGNLSEEDFYKYEKAMLRNYSRIASNSCVHCPACNDCFVEVSLDENNVSVWCSISCPKCKHHFCGKCGYSPHTSGLKEKKPEDLTCTELAAQKSAEGNDECAFDVQAAGIQIKACPDCGNACEKTSGECNFVYCRCKASFCFLCGMRLEDKDHYKHFRDRPGCVGPFGPVCRNTSTGVGREYAFRKRPGATAPAGSAAESRGSAVAKKTKKSRHPELFESQEY